MRTWRAARVYVLIVLLVTLGGVAYSRGFAFRLGAAPARLLTPHQTEEAWVVNEIVRDITELSVEGAGRTPSPSIVAGSPGRYTVTLAEGRASELDLRERIWEPDRYVEIARLAGITASPDESKSRTVHATLRVPTPTVLVAVSRDVNKALVRSRRDVSAHEAAALTIGAFALRESAGRAHDTRWALNRMTAHLALARALRGERSFGMDGALAQVILHALTNRQVEALAQLEHIEQAPRDVAAPEWARALRMRITDDWRMIARPEAAMGVEQHEYFRARRATVRRTLGRIEAEKLGVPFEASWLRIMASESMGVEDGWLLTKWLELERTEYERVYQAMHGEPLRDATAALHARATRAVSAAGLDILPWGAWAEFAQRHLAMYVARTDSFYRHTLGSPERADAAKRQVAAELGTLSRFPLATLWWTKGPRGKEADLRYIDAAVTSVLETPELVLPMEWSFLEMGTHYEPVRRGIPTPGTWYMAAGTRVGHETLARIQHGGHSRDLAAMEALLREAPYDDGLAAVYLQTKFGQKVPHDEVARVFGLRRDYDLRALEWFRNTAPDPEARLTWQRTACAISGVECWGLAHTLSTLDRDDEAARAFEQAFADPGMDAVRAANGSSWLVKYYVRKARIADARALAARAASTYSRRGLNTAADLAEHLGSLDEAETLYRQAADRYERREALTAFYYRMVHLRKRAEYESRLNGELSLMFPNGLKPVVEGGAPTAGAVITRDSAWSRSVGLQNGDVIVGVEGWQVETAEQLEAANAFQRQDTVKLAVWRNGVRHLELKTRERSFDVEYATYPLQGWAK